MAKPDGLQTNVWAQVDQFDAAAVAQVRLAEGKDSSWQPKLSHFQKNNINPSATKTQDESTGQH